MHCLCFAYQWEVATAAVAAPAAATAQEDSVGFDLGEHSFEVSQEAQ